MTGALRLGSVSKSYVTRKGRIEALSRIDLEIRTGEFLCIVGPSGCGKSTLLSLIAGLEKPDSGSVELNGRRIASPGPERVLIFQEAALFPWLSVIENIEYGLKLRGVARSERRDRSLRTLEMVGLRRFKDAYPHQLSGGMKQRVAIARGLVLDPEILLMDEPFAALDAQTRDLLHEELQEIWRLTGKTIVFITHNVREAACLGDRVVLMSPHPGRIHSEYSIPLPRARCIEDPAVMGIARAITTDLKLMMAEAEFAREQAQGQGHGKDP